MDQTMHALRIHHRGGPEGLVYEQAPVPSPDIGDVLLRVAGASLTPTELAWPSTWVDRRGLDRSPVIPCHEVSGVVVQLGSGTSGFELGDELFGITDWYRDGTAAEFVAVEARNLAHRPSGCGAVEAALDVAELREELEGLLPADGVPGAGGEHGDAAAELFDLEAPVHGHRSSRTGVR